MILKRRRGRNWEAETRREMLTEKRIAAIPIPKKRVTQYDQKVDALGIKVEPSGTKGFFWFRSVPDEGQHSGGGKPTWKTIGEWPATSLDSARATAQKYNVMLEDWKRSGCKGPNPFRSPAKSELTLNDLVEAYATKHLANHAKNPDKAVRDVRWQLKKYLGHWKQRSLATITRDDVSALHSELAKKHGRKGKPAHITANSVVQSLRAMFNWAARENFYGGDNPAARIEQYRKTKRDRFLQPDEVIQLNKVLDATDNADARDFIMLALETAARKSNITGMRWEEINWTLSTWVIPDPKNRFPQTIELTRDAFDILRRRFNELKEQTNPWVFPSRGKSGHVTDFKKAWTKICTAAKIENATIHDLRRTRASYMALAGASLLQIGAVLGHRDPQSTAIYARLNQQAQREAQALGASKMLAMIAEAKKAQKQLPAQRNRT